MDGQALVDGKARVRAQLVDVLSAQGMVRPRGVSVDAHAAAMDSLCARLAYMADDALAGLAEIVAAKGDGKRGDVWPSVIAICAWAARLQPPPPSDSRMIVSFLRSVAGTQARAERCLPELLAYLKRQGEPPKLGGYAWNQIIDDAAANRRRARKIMADMDSDFCDPREAAWLKGWTDARAHCLLIMGINDDSDGVAI
jgi:hypothetical protein